MDDLDTTIERASLLKDRWYLDLSSRATTMITYL